MDFNNFASELKTNGAAEVLQKLSREIESNEEANQLITNLLVVAPNLDDIIKLLNAEKPKEAVVVAVFNVIGSVLMKLVNDESFEGIYMHTVRWILQNHSKQVVRLLSSSSPNENIAALHFLTAIVATSSSGASELITHVNFKHINFPELVRKSKNDSKSRSLRTKLLCFILAFLNCGDDRCLSYILQNVEFITSLFEGLLKDPCELVVKLLSSLHRCVVLNKNISKSTKVLIFNSTTCKYLLALYFSGSISIDCTFDSNEREKISTELHKLLLSLCSDLKHGIIFKERATEYQSLPSNNNHVFLILKTLNYPWEFEKGRELVASTLTACPDVFKLYTNVISSVDEPRISWNFMSLIKLYALIIQKKTPWTRFQDFAEEGENFKSCSISIPFISKSLVITLLSNPSIILRHAGVDLMISLFTKAKETIDKISTLDFIKDKKRERLKINILHEISILSGGVNKCISQWSFCFIENSLFDPPEWYAKDYPTHFGFMYAVCNWFCLYAELFGWNLIRDKINPMHMLQKVMDIPSSESESDLIHYKKLLKSILDMHSIAQRVGSFEAFGFLKNTDDKEDSINIQQDMFEMLMTIYVKSNPQIDDSTQEIDIELRELSVALLNNSLNRWGLSLYADHCLNIWLNKVNPESCKEICKFLSNVIAKAISNLFSYLDLAITYNTQHQDESCKVSNLIEEVNNLSNDFYVKDNDDVKISEIKIPFSCIMLAAIDLIRDQKGCLLVEYFSSVIMDYIYCINNPKLLAMYLLENDDILNQETRNYLHSWISTEKNSSFDVTEKSGGVFALVKATFVSSNIPSVSTFSQEIEEGVKNCNDLITLSKQILLYIQNELRNSQHRSKRLKTFVKIFEVLVGIPAKRDGEFASFEQFFRFLIDHPFVLQSYAPFAYPLSAFQREVMNIINIVVEEYSNLKHLLKPYISKLISQIVNVHTSQDFDVETSLKLLSLFDLISFNDIEQIVIQLLKHSSIPCSQSYAKLLSNTIGILCKYTSVIWRPKPEISSLLLKQTRISRANCEEHEIFLIKDILTALSKVVSTDFIKTIRKDDLVYIMSSKIFNATLCSKIVGGNHATKSVISKLLNEIEVPFLSSAPLVRTLLEMGGFTEAFKSYLSKCKSDLTLWACSNFCEENEDCMQILRLIIDKKLFSLEELLSIAQSIYNESVVSKQQISPHITSLLPLFSHLSRCYEDNTNIFENSLHPDIQLLFICIYGVSTSYKKKSSDNTFLLKLIDVINTLACDENATLFGKEVASHKLWLAFGKQILKRALYDLTIGPKMLNCLTNLYKIIFTKVVKDSTLTPSTLYQMLRSHSQFIPIMLSCEEEFQELKAELVFLQLAIVESYHEVCEERHIPILLGSYHASRSLTDQGLLKILFLYEQHAHMPIYQPNLWGQAAVTHFAVEGGPGIQVGYKTPKHHQVLALLDSNKVIETALKFDMYMEMEPLSFYDDESTIYDQRFLLNLFVHMTMVEPRYNVMDIVEKGAVAVGLAALTSRSETVWSVGATLLQNIVLMFQSSKHVNLKLQWIWLIAVVGYGLNEEPQRLPSIIIHFLIQASLLLLTPEDGMYKPVMNYLYLKPSLELFKVPELYNLFFSTDVENHKIHRNFLLSILESGIRDEIDYEVCRLSYFPKLILSLISSPTVNSDLRIISLRVLKSMVNLPNGIQDLKQTLFIQLPLALISNPLCPSSDLDLWITEVVDILVTFWRTLKRTKYIDLTPESKTSAKSSKRKASDTHYSVNSSTQPVKRKKLSNTRKQDFLKIGNEDMIQNTKLIDKQKSIFSKEIKEFLLFLATLLPDVISKGKEKSVLSCLSLLNDVLTSCEHFNSPSNLNNSFIDLDFLKSQVILWVDFDLLEQRFGHLFSPEDLRHLRGLDASEMWKTKSLNLLQNHQLDQDIDKTQNSESLLRGMKSLIQLLYPIKSFIK